MEWGVGPAGAGLLSQFPTTPVVSDEEMLANARASLDRGLPIVKPCEAHDLTLCIAAGGPSLQDTYRDLHGVVVAVNGSLKFLNDKEVPPWGCGVMDPGAHMPDIVPRVEGVHYLIGSICNPALFDHLEGMDVGLWHPGGVDGLWETLGTKRNSWTVVAGGSTMGLRWLNLGYVLGFRRFEFHGLDSSYRESGTHAYPDHTDDADHLVIEGYHTKLAFVRQVADFFAILDAFSGQDVDEISIEIKGTGWLQDRWHAFREENPDAFKLTKHTAETEREKYELMWEFDSYRYSSPGEHLVGVFLERMGAIPGDSVIDFGCGPGRATQKLQDAGLKVLGIDIAANCLDPDVSVPLRVECLWDFPDDIEVADWGYCCDVMEHIPPDKVDATLKGIRDRTKEGVFFNIAFQHDTHGEAVGKRLHLTVHSKGWWENKLREHWPRVELLGNFDDQPRAVFKCCM